mmetsp:Transcript_14803/g.40903  ORF Transcript_14803/g.40903 Transcript_14803/m.40903 type:complete len:338 (+) Transcript_14803:2304-3317(+)
MEIATPNGAVSIHVDIFFVFGWNGLPRWFVTAVPHRRPAGIVAFLSCAGAEPQILGAGFTGCCIGIIIVPSRRSQSSRPIQVLFPSVLVQDSLFLFQFQIRRLGSILLLEQFHLRWIGLGMNFTDTLFLRVPSKELRVGQLHGVAANTGKIISGKLTFFGGNFGIGIVAHGARFGIVIGRIGIQIAQVFGRVFPNSQVTGRHLHLGTAHATLPSEASGNDLVVFVALHVFVVAVVGIVVVVITIVVVVVIIILVTVRLCFELIAKPFSNRFSFLKSCRQLGIVRFIVVSMVGVSFAIVRFCHSFSQCGLSRGTPAPCSSLRFANPWPVTRIVAVAFG